MDTIEDKKNCITKDAIVLNSFEVFEKIAQQYLKDKNNNSSSILFRGQSNSEWHLESKLSRKNNEFSVLEYCKILQKIKKEFENITSKNWDFDCASYNGVFVPPIGYEFMSYVRHLGFPTPILDWTRDYNVALFFAFEEKPQTDFVSVYIYQEYPQEKNFKGGLDSFAYISNLYNTPEKSNNYF